MLKIAAGWVMALCVLASASDSDVVQTLRKGRINWSAQTLGTTGSGPPSLKAANATVARLGAERLAKADALVNLLELMKTMSVTGKTTVAAMLETTPDLKGQVEGLLKTFKVLDTRYFADGGVDITVEMSFAPVADLLLAALPRVQQKAAQAPEQPAPEFSGVVVNAKGLKLIPALAARLVDESGQEIYSASWVSREVLRQRGVAVYTRSLDAALKDPRLGDKPIVVRPLAVVGDGRDLQISASDGKRLATAPELLHQAKVMVVVD